MEKVGEAPDLAMEESASTSELPALELGTVGDESR